MSEVIEDGGVEEDRDVDDLPIDEVFILTSVSPSLKPSTSVPFVLKNRITYNEVNYVGNASRHLLSRIIEDKSRSSL